MPLNNQKNIAIVGFGDLGKQFYIYLKEIYPTANFVAFDDIATDNFNNSVKLTAFQLFKNKEFNTYDFYVALGYKKLTEKKSILDWLIAEKRSIPTFIHTTAYVAPMSKIADGVFVFPGVIVDSQTEVNQGSILNLGVTIAHDTKIGYCTYLSPNVVVSGFSRIGNFTFIGSGTIISNNISIGNNAIIGIGSVVTINISENTSAIGNPARVLSKPLIIR